MSIPEEFSLPAGWATARLTELIAADGLLSDGDWVETKDQDPGGEIRLTQLADVGDGFWRDRSNRFLTADKAEELGCTFLKRGDVLIARMPDPLGRSCLFPGARQPCVTVVDVCIVRPGSSGANSAWLMNTINSPRFRIAVSRLQSGSTRKRISKKNLSTISVPVPPLPEQHRIVEAIETQFTRLDAAVETLKRVQANLKRYRASVLKAAVEGRLVPTEAELARQEGRDYEPASVLLDRILKERRRRWEEAELTKMKAKGKEPKNDNWKAKYKEPVGPDTNTLPALPEGWCWATVDQCFAILAGVGFPKKYQGESGQPVPVFKVGEISRAWQGNQRVLKESPNTVSLDLASQLASQLIPQGSIVFAKIGAAIGLNRRAITGLPCLADNNVMGLHPIPSLVSLRYAYHFACTLRLMEISQATTVPSVRKSDIRRIPFPLPPVEEQERVGDELDRHISVEAETRQQVAADLQRCNRLRQAILKWAFAGKLVNQDPGDEPVAVLLERIRCESNGTQPRPSRRTTSRKPRG